MWWRTHWKTMSTMPSMFCNPCSNSQMEERLSPTTAPQPLQKNECTYRFGDIDVDLEELEATTVSTTTGREHVGLVEKRILTTWIKTIQNGGGKNWWKWRLKESSYAPSRVVSRHTESNLPTHDLSITIAIVRTPPSTTTTVATVKHNTKQEQLDQRTDEVWNVIDGFLEVSVTVVANGETQLDRVGVFDGHHEAANGQMLRLCDDSQQKQQVWTRKRKL